MLRSVLVAGEQGELWLKWIWAFGVFKGVFHSQNGICLFNSEKVLVLENGAVYPGRTPIDQY